MKDTDDSAILHLEVGDSVASSNTKGRGNRRKFPVVDSDQVRTLVDKTPLSGEANEPELVFRTPCTVSGLGAGCSSGILGFVFGFGGYWLKERGRGVLKQALKGGLSSAKTFAVLGGLYTGVTCFMTRLRKKSDALNSGAAGCSTGLVLGWSSGGHVAAIQNCIMFGLFSYFLDNVSDGDAVASEIGARHCAGRRKLLHRNQSMSAKEWLQPCLSISYFNSFSPYFSES